MATTSFSLGEHFEIFIKRQVATGRFATASEVLRESLRQMELRETKLEVLRAAVHEGLDSGEAAPLDIDEVKREARAEYVRRQAKA